MPLNELQRESLQELPGSFISYTVSSRGVAHLSALLHTLTSVAYVPIMQLPLPRKDDDTSWERLAEEFFKRFGADTSKIRFRKTIYF